MANQSMRSSWGQESVDSPCLSPRTLFLYASVIQLAFASDAENQQGSCREYKASDFVHCRYGPVTLLLDGYCTCQRIVAIRLGAGGHPSSLARSLRVLLGTVEGEKPLASHPATGS